MSIRCIDWAFRQKCKSSSQKLVLLKLADNANDEGYCWPSRRYICDHCQMTKSTVTEHVKGLAELKLITIVPRFHNNVRLSNEYFLQVPGNDDPKYSPSEHDVRGSRNSRPGWSATDTKVVGHDDPESSVEPSLKLKNTATPRLPVDIVSDSEVGSLVAALDGAVPSKDLGALIVWIRQSKSMGHSPNLIVKCVQAYLNKISRGETVDKIRSYLIKTFDILEGKENDVEFERDHEKGKQEERDWASMFRRQ